MTEIWNLSALCRCCHIDGNFKNLMLPYNHEESIEIYSQMLQDTFGIWISPPAIDASYSICDNCIVKLREAKNFKDQVLNCELKFQEYCQNEIAFDSISVKSEVDLNDDNVDKMEVNIDNDVDVDSFKHEVDRQDGILAKMEKCESPDLKSDNKRVLERRVHKSRPTKIPKCKNVQKRPRLVTKICEVCDKRYDNLSSLKEHIKAFHAGSIDCPKCLANFENYDSYSQHLSTCKKDYECKFCGKIYGNLPNLNEHENSQHPQANVFICDYCQKNYYSKNAIREHILLKHMGAKNLQQPCINLKKKIFSAYKKSKRTTMSSISCPHCGKSFGTSRSLKQHLRLRCPIPIHPTFPCNLCKKPFSSVSTLKRHKLNIHYKKHKDGAKYLNHEVPIDNPDNILTDYIKVESQSHDGLSFEANDCCSDTDLPKIKHDVAVKQEINIPKNEESKSPELKKALKLKQTRTNSKFEIEETKSKGIKKLIRKRNRDTTICKVCDERFDNSIDLNTHLDTYHISQVACQQCKEIFEDIDQFNKHVTTCIKIYKCKFCKKTFSKFADVLIHENAKHTKRNTYICDICDRIFYTKNVLKNHIISLHDETRVRFQCEICGRYLSTKSQLKYHVMCVHENKKRFQPVDCSICGKNYASKKNLQSHLKLKHKKELSYRCKICGKGFLNSNGRSKHLGVVHNIYRRKNNSENDLYQSGSDSESNEYYGTLPHVTKKPLPNVYTCKVCPEIFYVRSQYQKHVRLHSNMGQLPYTCEKCGKNFSCPSSLKRHVENHDPKMRRQYPCDICGKRFSAKFVALRHKRLKHDPLNDVQGVPKKIQCPICKVYVKDLEKHQQRHILRPFHCEMCEKTYPAKNALNRHIQHFHLLIRNFRCTECGKGYTRVQHLDRHMKVHKPKSEPLL